MGTRARAGPVRALSGERACAACADGAGKKNRLCLVAVSMIAFYRVLARLVDARRTSEVWKGWRGSAKTSSRCPLPPAQDGRRMQRRLEQFVGQLACLGACAAFHLTLSSLRSSCCSPPGTWGQHSGRGWRRICLLVGFGLVQLSSAACVLPGPSCWSVTDVNILTHVSDDARLKICITCWIRIVL